MLNKSILFIFLGVLKLSYSYSQDTLSQEIGNKKFLPEFEFFGGPGFLFPRADSAYYAVSLKPRSGYTIGVGILCPIGNRMQLSSKFISERKAFNGSLSPTTQIGSIDEFDIKNNYSTLVITPGILIGRKRLFSISAGGYLSFLTRSKISFDYTDNSTVPDQLRLQTEQFNRLDAGLSFGIRYKVPLRQHLFLNLQLSENYGLRNILNSTSQPYNDEVLYYFNGSTLKNNTVSFLMGISGLLDKPKLGMTKNTGSRHFFSKTELLAGPAISFLRGNVGVETTTLVTRKLKIGYTFGLGLVHTVDDRYDISAQFLFERKGGVSESITIYFDEATQSLKQGKVNTDYSYDYYTLPIFADCKFGQKRRLNIGFGPFASYLQKQILTEKFLYSGAIQTRVETDLNTKFDFGIASKIGYVVPLKSNVDIRFQLLNTRGLINTRLNTYPGQIMNSNNTSLLIGIIFNQL